MPELPDVTIYVEHLARLLTGEPLAKLRVASPNLLRTVDPPYDAVVGKRVLRVRRSAKRIVLAFEDELFVAIHLMIAGRLHWKPKGATLACRVGLAAFDFASGTLTLTEASTKQRAGLHVLRGEAAVAALAGGGVEPLEATRAEFAAALARENHTLKRALTDPRLFSGLGNSYSDEILHRARLSPLTWTTRLSADEVTRLHVAVQSILREWTDRLRADAKEKFPEKVSAFRKGMAVHGRFKQPCPDCGAPVQRIVYAENETNYCACCQTGGRLLADRALSRLLHDDWPRTLEELEEGRTAAASPHAAERRTPRRRATKPRA